MTTTDSSYLASISRESRLVSLACESYSLAGESESAFYASHSQESESLGSMESTYQATRSDAGGTHVTPGATPQSVAPETTSWVERPSAAASVTAQGRTGNGAARMVMGKGNVLCIATVVLAIFGMLC